MEISLLSTQTHLRPVSNDFSVMFTIGDFDFTWYAFFFIMGFFISLIIGCLILNYRYKISYDILFWYTFLLIPSAILGARLWSAMIGDLSWDNFFNFRSGGLAIQGGVILAGIVGVIYFLLILRKPKYHIRIEQGDKVIIAKPSLWIIIDAALPLILLGQAIGRWGNFFNGEIFGPQTTAESLLWLKNIMPGVYDHMQAIVPIGTQTELINGAFYQPLFLYESFTNIMCFSIVYFILPNFQKIRIGVIGSSYFLIYGVIRFIYEPLRFAAYEFTGTYIVNSILLVFGLCLIIVAQFISPKFRHEQVLYKIWVTKIRFIAIKLGIKCKFNWALKFEYEDKGLKNYGFAKPISFERNESNAIYYANR